MVSKGFLTNRDGGVLVFMGLAMLLLFAMGGAAIDFGRQQLVRVRLQQATDAAALAAGTKTGASEEVRRQAAQRYYKLNFPPSLLGVDRPEPTITFDGERVRVSAGTKVTAHFIANANIGTLDANGRTTVNLANSSLDADVIMIIDETGSTAYRVSGGDPSLNVPGDPIRMEVIRAAFSDFVSRFMPSNNTNPNLRVGMIGYSSYVTNKWGLTSDYNTVQQAIASLRPVCNNYDYVGLDTATNMFKGATSSGLPDGPVQMPRIFLRDLYPQNCPVANEPKECGYSYDCTVAENTDAPSARTQRTKPGDGYDLSKAKNVIFFTDGDVMTDATPCQDIFAGRNGPDCYATPTSRDFQKFRDSCNALKATGAHMYVVAFATPPGVAEAVLRECASPSSTSGQPDFYYAADASDLSTKLNVIGERIAKLRISE